MLKVTPTIAENTRLSDMLFNSSHSLLTSGYYTDGYPLLGALEKGFPQACSPGACVAAPDGKAQLLQGLRIYLPRPEMEVPLAFFCRYCGF